MTQDYVDNEAAIAIINENWPIQEWQASKELVMQHIPGIINPSDNLTKALYFVFHSQHARRSMGHYRIGSPKDSESPVCPPMLEQGPSESGRVLEPICDHPSIADNSTSHVEKVVWSQKLIT